MGRLAVTEVGSLAWMGTFALLSQASGIAFPCLSPSSLRWDVMVITTRGCVRKDGNKLPVRGLAWGTCSVLVSVKPRQEDG